MKGFILLAALALAVSSFSVSAQNGRDYQTSAKASPTANKAMCDDKEGCKLCADHKTKEECANNCKVSKAQTAAHSKSTICPLHDAKPKVGA